MTNILVDKLPTEIDGLKINTNFRVSILWEIMMCDNNLSNEEKTAQTLELYYGAQEIKDPKQALKNVMWFYSCGKDYRHTNDNSGGDIKQIYSFEYDDDYIFSAFFSKGIDLNKITYMHWWKFKSIFNDLPDDCMLSKAMYYRSIDLSKIDDDKERKRISNMKIYFSLPDLRTEEEKENEFSNALW